MQSNYSLLILLAFLSSSHARGVQQPLREQKLVNDEESQGQVLSNLLLAAKVAPKKIAPVRKPLKKVAPKKAVPATKPVKKVAPKKVVRAAKPVKKTVAKRSAVPKGTGSALRQGKKKFGAYGASTKEILFDVRELGGLTDPNANLLGFANVDPYDLGYFDPSGLTIGASENKIRSYREAELKHGRIAMLASLGFVVGENYHPLYDGDIDGPSVYALQKAFDIGPNTLLLPILFVMSCEMISSAAVFRISPDPLKTFELDSDYIPGDVLAPLGLRFDPLGLAPKDPEAFKEMQTKELNNGRVAMIASIIFFFQEAYTGKAIFA
jgi:hypothetical protein